MIPLRRGSFRSIPLPSYALLFSFIIALFSLLPAAGEGAEVAASWNTNPEPDIAGYKVYCGTSSRNYQFFIDAGNKTTFTISNLENGKTYYFAVTAYTASGKESNHSREMAYTPPIPCSYSITPTSQTFGPAGGEGTVNVSAHTTCPWAASSDASWVVISSKTGGTGNGAIPYSVLANSGTSARTATLTIAGKILIVTQKGIPPSESRVVFAVNCGGPQYVDKAGITYLADTRFSGGSTYKTTAAIAGTEDDPLYQSERFGNFTYNVPVANGNYAVTLKFAEIYHYAPGARIFSVKIEGKEVITNLDLYAKVGRYRAYDLQFPVTVTDGMLNIDFRSVKDTAKAGAIIVTTSGSVSQHAITASAGPGGAINPQGVVKVNAGSDQSFTVAANDGYQIADVKVDGASKGAVNNYVFIGVNAPHTIEAAFAPKPPGNQAVFAVNCGGLQYTDKAGVVYQADARFSGGNTYKTTAAIAGSEDAPLYQSERFGNFSYNIPVASGSYSVNLKFAEIYNYTPGSRIFSVKVEGREVITNLDIYARVGRYRAYDVKVPVTVTDGMLNIEFPSVVGNAKVNAILVEKN